MHHFTKQFLVLSLVMGTCVASHAQFGGGAGGMRRGRSADSQGEAKGGGSGRSTSAFEAVSGSLYDLRIRLLISPEQGPAWENFRARMVDFAVAGAPLRPVSDEQTTLQAVEGQREWARKRASLSESLYAASTALFAVLSADQKQTADRAIPQMLADLDNRGRSAERSGIR